MDAIEELEVAASIAQEAGRLVLTYLEGDRMQARTKGEKDVVTAADTASEGHISSRIKDAFPRDGVVAEEGTRQAAPSGRRWYVDPLDGTVNFAHRVPIWCISMSLFDGEGPLLGVIYDPVVDETLTAARGHGAHLNGQPITTSGITDPNASFVHLTIDFNPESLWTGLQDIHSLAPQVLRTRNIGSAALALAYVACGRFDAMVHRAAHTWDYGAGVLMIEEAGGAVSEIDGSPYAEETTALVAGATPELQAEIRGMIKEPASSGLE